MFDIFYIGKKPQLFPHETAVCNIDEAKAKSKTRYFWIVDYLCNVKNFDFLWEPVPWESNFMHTWPSQWQKSSGIYLVPKEDFAGIKYHDYPVIQRVGISDNWEIPDGIDDSDFDYTWHPDETDPPYIYQFGTQHQRTGGPRYVNGEASEIKFVEYPRVIKESVGDNWEIPDGIDASDFDYTWHPDETDPPYIYQFGTQHQRTGGPLYVMPDSNGTKFVQNVTVKINSSPASLLYFIDHSDGNLERSMDTVGVERKDIKTTRYASDYLNTLKRIANKVRGSHEYIWVCSSVCDYTNFDFSWHPEQWQSNMIHVFPSGEQKFGDTFFLPVNGFLQHADEELLDWYPVNFITSVSVNRWPLPVIKHDHDNQVDALKTFTLDAPLSIITNTQDRISDIPTISLWREKTKTITPLSEGASSVIVPRESVPYINEQLYDYPYINKTFKHLSVDNPMDIVFISNGESVAEKNWEHLLEVANKINNRVVRIDGVDGRVAAYHAALSASNTDWAFCVFAKLEIDPKFDFSWQPDRLQERKHYIFNARNPVNGLEYGHMAMIAYNRKLALENNGTGLDFTLDQKHATVPILSGISHFNNDPWMTWRTAFREALKLRHSGNDIENQYRLYQWQTVSEGDNGEWSMAGANDAVDYYESVKGDFEKLKLSYEWGWLKEFYDLKYSQ